MQIYESKLYPTYGILVPRGGGGGGGGGAWPSMTSMHNV